MQDKTRASHTKFAASLDRVKSNRSQLITLRSPAYEVYATHESTTMTEFHKDFTFKGGDIKITVDLSAKGEIKRIAYGRVCSQTLCLASPVLKLFIYPPFPTTDEAAEEDKRFLASIDFTEDSAWTLKIILDICRLRFSEFPRRELPVENYRT
ncbi:hypothetical protein BJ875DRAFT_211290 [Amylocarpus encephaloides]|uniref:Uncharacterized protein n=1 Tax=Amylocarpus encephaloides TaxID=45428 RepID=A0A9P7Y8J0_9HELO|nr:hypothetical protein BJ875DRAFT_211290 [Amylocarpus encephaloides]